MMHFFLVLVAFLLRAFVTPRTCSAASTTASSSSPCSASVICGKLNITYPFYLSSDAGAAAFCGYPGLGLACVDGNTTVLRLSANNNTVLAINYPSRTMFVVDSGIRRAAAACPGVTHNVTLAPGSRLQFTTSDASLTFFLGCRASIPSRCSNGSFVIGCDPTGVAAAGESSYVFRGAAPGGALVGSGCARFCSGTATMPVYGALFDSPTLANLTTSYGQVLKNGFELSWGTSSDPQCDLCERSGGSCSYNSTASGGGSGLTFGCVCPDGWRRPSDCGRRTTGNKIRIYLIATMTSISFLVLLFLAYLVHCKRTYGSFMFWRKGSYIAPRVQAFLQKYESFHPKIYTYVEVRRMTKSFEHELGKGGCGVVYKGKLPDGRSVAVKLLKESKGDDEQFMNEVATISTTSHVNIVSLLGFCIQGSKRALIYDYMPNGSLERFISGNHSDRRNSLSWEKLYEIAAGIARGLEYLHRGCNTRIVHFDIKPHNILLDENFCPKISDFGLAELSTQKESTISIGVARGTVGYIAPEVFSRQFGVVSSKSDVYSYGMMILEMVGSMQNVNINSGESTDDFYFPRWIYENLDQYCLDASEMDVGAGELVRRMIIVGLWCVHVMPIDRPSMSKVLEMLESTLTDPRLPSKRMTSFLDNCVEGPQSLTS